MLVITDDDIKKVFTMSDCIEAMQKAFVEEAEGVAVQHPRMRYKVPPDLDTAGYMDNIIAGAVPSFGVAALRHNSMIVHEFLRDDMKRWESQHATGRSWGFVLLFSLATGEPLAYIHDLGISAMRVGATTGAAHRALARKDAKTLGLFGSGYQAVRNLEAISCVRKIERVSVFSPRKEHRDRFAGEMAEMLGLEVRPVATAEAAVKGMDIVMSATNSSQPVFDGRWLEPGQIVTTIANTDGVHRRTEADSTTMIRADLVVVNSKKTVLANQQVELIDLIEQGKFGWDKVRDLGDVLAGRQPGRTSDRDIVYYKSNSGVGIQFAAAGAVIYEACRKAGLGRELPAEWFGADLGEWLAKGYNPST